MPQNCGYKIKIGLPYPRKISTMKNNAHILFYATAMALVLTFSANAQVTNIDSLKNLLSKESDTARIKTMIAIGGGYDDKYKYDTALYYYLDALKLAESVQEKKSLFLCLNRLALFYEHKNNFQLALEFALRAQKIAEEENSLQSLFDIYNYVGGVIYFNHGNFDTSLIYGFRLMKIAVKMNDRKKMADGQMYLGDAYRALEKFDSALAMYLKALELSKATNYKDNFFNLYNDIGLLYDEQGQYRNAIAWFLKSIAQAAKDSFDAPNVSNNLVNAYFHIKRYDSALLFAKKLLQYSEKNDDQGSRLVSYWLLSQIYEAEKTYSEAYNYLDRYLHLKDSVNSTEEQNKLNLLESEYKTDKQKREIELLQKNSQLQGLLRNVLIATAILLLILAFLIANKYNHKKKAEEILSIKNSELNRTLNELKSTQAQLIQSEKMASLGELTAGIAHEIQNPLNFVNNFSEVSNELLQELKDERQKTLGQRDEELQDELLADISQNLAKINHHGKRADAIVKGMLQHSRKITGQKDRTDINQFADEYLRLAYQGLRAKDKSFNATLKTEFDETIGKINIIPQDIGRVLLNLFNNAFYAVTERQKAEGEDYKPAVSETTKQTGDKIEIRVADNGTGIPDAIKGKIMQPFFTTKPTGQGTGLGLSLSYDIVKAHGGEIRVGTKEGEGTEFVITLPIT